MKHPRAANHGRNFHSVCLTFLPGDSANGAAEASIRGEKLQVTLLLAIVIMTAAVAISNDHNVIFGEIDTKASLLRQHATFTLPPPPIRSTFSDALYAPRPSAPSLESFARYSVCNLALTKIQTAGKSASLPQTWIRILDCTRASDPPDTDSVIRR
jgi:hypothetical protein